VSIDRKFVQLVLVVYKSKFILDDFCMAARGENVETKSDLFDIRYGTKSGFCSSATTATTLCSNNIGCIHTTKAVSSHSIESEIFQADSCGTSKSLSITLPANASSFSQFLDDWLSDKWGDEPSDDDDLSESAGRLQINEHSGALFKVDRFTRDASSRFAKFTGEALVTYSDNSELVQKERVLVTSITSIQRLMPYKHRGDVQHYCFEVNLVPTKGSKASYIFGSPNQELMVSWLRILTQAMTLAFTDVIQTCSRVGGCCLKKPLNPEWCPASIMLTRRRSLLWTLDAGGRHTVDLRKVKSINQVEDDVIAVETPDDTLHFKLPTAQESIKWRDLIQMSALRNGDRLQDQQLTKNDVPVVVERCIDFIFAHGLRAEGVYRKSGSTTQIQRLLEQFKMDAHTVRLCPTDYNVHTVAGCLKKFMRDLPASLIGDLSMSFIGVSSEYDLFVIDFN
jgi:RhoGAP domain